MTGTYLPLFAEKKCTSCGSWRGQHTVIGEGDPCNDDEMYCPDSIVATFRRPA